MAAERGHAAVVAALLEGGADPERRNPAGASPIYLAVQNGHAAAAAALLAGGTDPDSTTPEGLTLLELAAKCGQVRVVLRGLATHSPQSPCCPSQPYLTPTPLQAEVITALCDGGADVDVTDAQGDTALHKLVQCWRDSKQLPNGKTDGKTEQYSAAARALLEGGAGELRFGWELGGGGGGGKGQARPY